MTDVLKQIEQWHKDARPVSGKRELTMAIAIHIEEFLEFLEQIVVDGDSGDSLNNIILAKELNSVEGQMRCLYRTLRYKDNVNVSITSREALLDSLGDQIVTAVGVGAAAGMNVPEAVKRVSISNDSKRLDDGSFDRDSTGKITKPAHYKAPDLSGLY